MAWAVRPTSKAKHLGDGNHTHPRSRQVPDAEAIDRAWRDYAEPPHVRIIPEAR